MEELCRKKRLKVLFKRSNKKPTTLSANGRSGWFSASENWPGISTAGSRQDIRQALRGLTQHLQSRAAICRWMSEETKV
jgi:hypothetical protein